MPVFLDIINSIRPALLSLLPVLVAVWIGYRLGLITYFRRKEHEQIIHRYLDQGVDLLSANIDHTLSVFRENWAHSLRLLKEFKGTASSGLPFRKESYQELFLKYEPKSFSIVPFYKVKSLVGGDIFWQSGQDLFAFVGSSYDFFENDLRLALSAYVDNRLKSASPEQIYQKYSEEIWRLNQEAERFYLILKELQNIALLLETKPISFKDLEKLKHHPEIRESIRLLKERFAESISIANKQNLVESDDPQA